MKNINKYFNKIYKLRKKNFKKLDNNSINFTLNKKELKSIKNIVQLIIEENEKKKFSSFKKLYQFLNKTNFYKISKNLDFFVNLENNILEILKKRQLINEFITGVEFPLGIRILHPITPKKLKSKFQTTSLHCDPWAGEPEDMINIVIYIEVSKQTPIFMLKKTNHKNILKNLKYKNYYKTKLFLNSKKYYDVLKDFVELKSHKINHLNGEVFLFNGLVPHATIKQGKKVRVGIELRLRTEDIYKDLKRFTSSINNSGRYWTVPSKKFLNFSERQASEFNYILKNYQNSIKIIKLRNKHTKLFLN